MKDAASSFQIFKPGRHASSDGRTLEFSDADLRATAAAYDPAAHEAPIVVGHPAANAPAYGWIGGLDYAEGALAAKPRQVDAEFADLVRDGRFKKVSASFYLPDAQANPAPGRYYLRHVGFLGAQPPAVKGLKPVEFAADEDGVVAFSAPVEFGDLAVGSVARLFRRLREFLIDKETLEVADRVLPAWDVDALTEEFLRPTTQKTTSPAGFSETDPGATTTGDTTMTKEELERREAELAAREADAAKKEAAFAELTKKHEETAKAQSAAAHALALGAAGAAADQLVADGRVAPGHRDGLTEFMAGLDDSQTVEFGEGGESAVKATRRGWFEGFLKSFPKQISFGETTGKAGATDTTDPQELANAAIAYREEMASKGVAISIDTAVRRIADKAGA